MVVLEQDDGVVRHGGSFAGGGAERPRTRLLARACPSRLRTGRGDGRPRTRSAPAGAVEVREQRQDDPAAGAEGRARLADGEGLRHLRSTSSAVVIGAGGEHDAVGEPEQVAGAVQCGQRARGRGRAREPVGVRGPKGAEDRSAAAPRPPRRGRAQLPPRASTRPRRSSAPAAAGPDRASLPAVPRVGGERCLRERRAGAGSHGDPPVSRGRRRRAGEPRAVTDFDRAGGRAVEAVPSPAHRPAPGRPRARALPARARSASLAVSDLAAGQGRAAAGERRGGGVEDPDAPERPAAGSRSSPRSSRRRGSGRSG